jgi:histidinol phosphatase-like PHP family hydrolase
VVARQAALGRVLLRKSLHRMRHLGIRPKLLVLLGDLVDDGTAPGADADLAELAETLTSMGVPALVAHGNHDGAPAHFEALFGMPGFRELEGYGFVVFNDAVAKGDFTTRSDDDLALLDRVKCAHPGLPLVVVQHNPVYPRVGNGGTYPYMLTNAEEVLAAYDRAGVRLSLSGHYHAGERSSVINTLTTYTVPALCEAPFTFAHVRLQDGAVAIHEHHLGLDVADVMDVHCHTEYAYCGTTVSAEGCLKVSEALGVGTVCLTEHAFHLYFDKTGAANYQWQTNPLMVQEAWRTRSGRMDEYRRFVSRFRSERVRLGLEVDLCADGSLLLAPEDAEGWDILVGAVHAIPGYVRGRTSPAETEALFLRETERLAASPIHVLAHPFRFFIRERLDVPVRLYPVVADLLAAHAVAAEVNFHTNSPDPAFVRACLSRGVKIALGTDAHDIVEAGEFEPHLRVLERAGIGRNELSGVLYR